MTAEYQYQMAVDLATSMARATTREKVLQSTWVPFQLLYVELAKRKEIETLSDLDPKKKRELWREACRAQPEAMKHKKIWLCQALLVFDLITEKS